MRILQTIHDHPAHPTIGGGGGIRMLEFSLRLGARGHDVHLLSGWFDGCEAFANPGNGCRITFLGPRRKPACKAIEFAVSAWRQLPELARTADVVVEDFSPYSPVGAFRLLGRGKPVVLQIQNYIGRQFLSRHGLVGLPLMALEQALPRCYPHRIFQSEALSARFPGGRTRCVIPSGVDASLLELAQGTGGYAAFLGRIDYHQKGLDLLLDAAARTGVPLRLAGDGPDRERLQREIATLPHVHYLGKLTGTAKVAFLQDAAFLVLPSRFEGQMMVVTEAAAAGCGVITSDIPELRYVTQAGIGRSFSPYEPEALASAIRDLWAAPDQQRAFAGRCREYARTFDWETLTDDYEQALVRVSRGERQPAP